MKKRLIKIFRRKLSIEDIKRETVYGDMVLESWGYSRLRIGQILKVRLFLGVWMNYKAILWYDKNR